MAYIGHRDIESICADAEKLVQEAMASEVYECHVSDPFRSHQKLLIPVRKKDKLQPLCPEIALTMWKS